MPSPSPDNVYALDAANGSVIWQRNVGAPVPLSNLPCGDIDPLGITGTPVVDLPSRTLFFDAMTTPDNGTTKKHLIYAMNVDTGTTNSGWPVDVNATAKSGSTVFTSVTQNERGALAVLGTNVYVPYGGHDGDCGTYYGWLVGVPLTQPTNVMAWATTATGGGAWSVGGVASDGVEPVHRHRQHLRSQHVERRRGHHPLPARPGFQRPDERLLGAHQLDYARQQRHRPRRLGRVDRGCPGGHALEAGGFAGQGRQCVSAQSHEPRRGERAGGQSAHLQQHHHPGGGHIPDRPWAPMSCVAVTAPTSSPSASRPPARQPSPACGPTSENGRGSPFVTSTDGTNNAIVWGIGSEGDQRLHGFNGDTGAVVFNGGGANELMAGTRRFNTAIAARGRIYVANDNKVYAFTVPVAPIILTNLTLLPGGAFQFGFTNMPGMSFTAYGTTNLVLPFANWTGLGSVTEISSGQFQFTDLSGAGNQERFYRVTSP